MVTRRLCFRVEPSPRSGSVNMASDEAMLRAVEASPDQAYLRLYGWDSPTLSLGFTQSFSATVDEDFCRREGISVVRRVTGGGAVLHHREHTYSVAMPYGWLEDQNLRCCYRVVSSVLVEALQRCGVPARSSGGDDSNQRHAVCFAATSRDEIQLEGRKLVGSAQRRGRHGFLQHGSILIGGDAEMHLGAVRGTRPSVSWSGIEDSGYRSPSRDELGRALAESLASVTESRLRSGQWSEAAEPSEDERARHASEDWLRRVP